MSAEQFDPTEYTPPELDLVRGDPQEPEFAPWENLAEEDFMPGGHDTTGPAVSLYKANMMVTDIKADLVEAHYVSGDQMLQGDINTRVFNELIYAASTQTGHLSVWAASLLDALWHRSRSGVPYGEPAEPAWSLDPDPSSRRRRNQGPRLDG